MLTISITGHRVLINEADVKENICSALDYFKEIDKDLVALSALAVGADLIFATEALAKQIPLKVVLPFAPGEYRNDFTGHPDALLLLDEILKTHQPEIVVQTPVASQAERDKAYLQTGMLLTDRADVVLAVWDEKPAAGKGGTGDIVAYAKGKGKEVHIIKGIRRADHPAATSPDEVSQLFTTLDNEAVKYKKNQFEPAWMGGIVFGLLGVLAFATGLAFVHDHTEKFTLAIIEISCLFASFILLAVYAKKWKNVFLLKRRGAEYLRAIIWNRDAGIPLVKLQLEDEYKPEKQILDIEQQVADNAVRIDNLPNAKRIAWTLADRQIKYHQHVRVNGFHKRLERMEKGMLIIKSIFFIVAPLSFVLEMFEYFHIEWAEGAQVMRPYLLFLSLTLPSWYAALEGIKYFGEWKRNISVSKKIIRQLKKVKQHIMASHDEVSIIANTKSLREILEIENYDWTARYDEKEVEAKI